MPATYISGALGSVTFASGYVTNAYKWSLDSEATLYETTAFTGSYSAGPSSLIGGKTRALALKKWSGSYSCRQATTAATTIAGHAYASFTYKYDITLSAEVLPGTKFTDDWERNDTIGLFDVEGTVEVYLEDTAALPLAGATVSMTVTVDTGLSYTFSAIADKDAVEVARDGSGRRVAISFKNSAESIGIAGGLPKPGVTGAATLTAHTSRTYSGTIAVKSVKLTMDANRTAGDWTIEFVGSDTLTAA